MKKWTKAEKLAFADRLIVLCITVGTVLTAFMCVMSWRKNELLTSGQLGVLFGFYGGELLTIALRQIFGSDAVEKAAKKAITIDDEDGSV